MEKEGFKIRLKKSGGAPEGYALTSNAPAPLLPPAARATSRTRPGAGNRRRACSRRGEGAGNSSRRLVGTFYSAMSPESPAYLKVGQTGHQGRDGHLASSKR